MTTKKKVLLGISIATIVGIAGYFIYKAISKPKPKSDAEGGGGVTDVKNNDPNTQQTPVSNTVSTPSSSSNSSSANRPDDILAFQTYANGQGYKPELVTDGLWGPKTSAAWKKHGTAYKAKEKADKASGELTGQLKTIFDGIHKDNKPKVYPRNYNNKGTVLMVEATSSDGNRNYYWLENGSFLAYDRNTKSWYQSGNYANNGKTLILTSGINKGKTFTGTWPAVIAGEARTPIVATQDVQQISDTLASQIAGGLLEAMDGPGTYVPIFFKYWNKMKTLQDYRKVKQLFGKPEGEELGQWIGGEAGLMSRLNKAKINKFFTSRGGNSQY
tara:strand:- start:2239 stop:3225 length:987 start_codon:yes stop_codon:yes gene_type:complete